MIRYPDPDNEGAEICLNNGHAWRLYADGREEDLSEEEEESWYQHLAQDNDASGLPPPSERAPAEPEAPRPVLSFDGCGINGPDEYRSRIATFTNAEAAATWGPLLAAAPRLLAAVKALRAVAIWDDEYVSEEQCEQACALADAVLIELGEKFSTGPGPAELQPAPAGIDLAAGWERWGKSTVPHEEGWLISNRSDDGRDEIQREDGTEILPSDDAALALVIRKALEGSELHRWALAVHADTLAGESDA